MSDKKKNRIHKKMDPDFKAIKLAIQVLNCSSSPTMLKANLEFINGHFELEFEKSKL